MSKAGLKQNHGHATADTQEYGVVTAPGTLRLERLLPGPIERIWSYLTEAELRGKWLATGAMEPRVGGRVELHFEHAQLSAVTEDVPEKYRGQEVCDFSGRIVRWEPPRVLAYTWGESRGGESEVTFVLTPRGSEVFLVVTHRGLVGHDETTGVAAGWHAHIGILIDHLAGRTTSRLIDRDGLHSPGASSASRKSKAGSTSRSRRSLSVASSCSSTRWIRSGPRTPIASEPAGRRCWMLSRELPD